MNCESIENEGLIRRFLSNELEGEARSRFKEHCASCASCRASLQLGATLMLAPSAVRAEAPVRVPEEESVSVWESLKSWLFPSGVGHWQPALAFAVIVVVAVPVLNGVWISIPPEVNSEMVLRGNEGPVAVVEQTQKAIKAMNNGDAKLAAALLSVEGVEWDEARVGDVRVAYRVLARAQMELGNKSKALKHLQDAQKLTMMDARAEECVAKDLKALDGIGDYCPLPKL